MRVVVATHGVEQRAWELIGRVEELGGSVEALEFMQREIESLFGEAKAATGLTGEIFFQVAAKFASPGSATPPAAGASGLMA